MEDQLKSQKRIVSAFLVCPMLFSGVVRSGAQEHEGAGSAELFTNLGDHSYEIGTSVAAAQEYFNQGLRLYYAFNHAESVNSFREAQGLDPECAMCWWGEALAFGPNINLPMDSASGVAAYRAVQRAAGLASNAGERERRLIEALAVRYELVPPADRSYLDSAYSSAVTELKTRYPDDPEIAVLFAESLMDLQPWDYWTEEKVLKPSMEVAVAALEGVLAVNPNHPGACHFLIHAVEKERPDLAVSCAERLAALMPGAGHIVHMPGHIYIRVGRYLEAVEANRHAVHADETYIQDIAPGPGMYTVGYYPHNYDFMAFAASMIGRREDAVSASRKVADLIPQEMIGQPGMGFLEHWKMRPLQFQVRFRMWEDILAQPQPSETLAHASGIWHYATGRALAAAGDIGGARQHLSAIRTIIEGPDLESLRMEFNESADLLSIAYHALAGWIAAESERYDDAVAHLEAAVSGEDALLYGEPPEWSVPVRQELGVVLLRAERWSDAERIFLEALDQFPENGWSYAGLVRALEEQGRERDAHDARQKFEAVWNTADVDIRDMF